MTEDKTRKEVANVRISRNKILRILATLFFIIWITIGLAIVGLIVALIVINPFQYIAPMLSKLGTDVSTSIISNIDEGAIPIGKDVSVDIAKLDSMKKDCIKKALGNSRFNELEIGRRLSAEDVSKITALGCMN